jgi:hypothetical protein
MPPWNPHTGAVIPSVSISVRSARGGPALVIASSMSASRSESTARRVAAVSAPLRLDLGLAREQRRIPRKGVAEQPLVWRHQLGEVAGHEQLRRLTHHPLPRCLDPHTERELGSGIDADTKVVRVVMRDIVEDRARRASQLTEELRHPDGKAFAAPDANRDAGPAPAVDVEPDGAERLDLGVRSDPGHAPITDELAADDVARIERHDRAE